MACEGNNKTHTQKLQEKYQHCKLPLEYYILEMIFN